MGVTGIIGAMDEEVEIYISRMDIKERCTIAGRDFIFGTLSGKEIALVKAGVGKVNSASCTQAMIDKYNVERIIFTGCAGSLENAIDIGDVVISTDCIQHDFDATALGFKPGEVMLMNKIEFAADRSLVDAAVAACKAVSAPYHVGRILSGDQFVVDKPTKDRIKGLFSGICAEMEGGAVAQTAFLNNVPFVIIRDISDKADEESNVDFNEFLMKASDTNAKVVCEMLKGL